MLTREQIEEIQTECRERGISVKNLLKEKGIPDHQYFWWKRKYSKQEVPEGDSSGLNVPPVSLSNVPGVSETNVPPISGTNVPGISL